MTGAAAPAPEPAEFLASLLVDAGARVADLERELAGIAESTSSGPDDEHDPEGSTVGYERARVTALLDDARRRSAEIERAVERLAAGTYGRCERCGRPIGPERLAALPTAARCVTCASSRS